MRDWIVQMLKDGSRILGLVLAVSIPTALMVTHVWYQFRITRLGYKISKETQRHEKLVDKHRKLEIEATVEGRGDRLTQIAKRRFGLKRVEPEQIIAVQPQTKQKANREAPESSEGAESLDETEHASLQQERTD